MIVDRQKELIKYKGFQGMACLHGYLFRNTKVHVLFQVPPAELESLLLTHPEIADAGVVGVESVSEATELPR